MQLTQFHVVWRLRLPWDELHGFNFLGTPRKFLLWRISPLRLTTCTVTKWMSCYTPFRILVQPSTPWVYIPQHLGEGTLNHLLTRNSLLLSPFTTRKPNNLPGSIRKHNTADRMSLNHSNPNLLPKCHFYGQGKSQQLVLAPTCCLVNIWIISYLSPWHLITLDWWIPDITTTGHTIKFLSIPTTKCASPLPI